MQTITQALSGRGAAGERLPTVFPALESRGFHFRRGHVTLIAGPPGGGKSALALALAVALGEGLYISADSDEFIQGTRMAAMRTGHRLNAITEAFEAGGSPQYYEEQLSELADVRFDFPEDPDLDDIEDEVNAYALVYGAWPALVVIDNLSDVWGGEGASGEYTGADLTLKFLKTLARRTRACVVVLHHLVGSKENGTEVAGMADLKGKVGKIPESVLTLWKAGHDLLGVAIVKNRGGPSDASGQHAVHLRFVPERMLVA